MRGKIGSAAGSASGSCCCDAARTTRAGTGRARIASGSTGCAGIRRPNGTSWPTTCSRLTTWRPCWATSLRGCRALAQRRAGQPPRVIAIADTAQRRLCRRFRRLATDNKPAPIIWARESPGFCGRRSIPQRRHSHRPTTGAERTCRAGWERAVQTANDSRHESEDRRDSYAVRTTVATRVLDCTSSRRTTVMRALPQATGVITEFQRDPSSKRPPSFDVWEARPPTDRLRASGNRRRAVRNIEVRQEVIPYQLSPSPWSSGDIASRRDPTTDRVHLTP